MPELSAFPLVTQQTKISADGSSPNANMDCVPTSILAYMMWLKGIPAFNSQWNPDKLLDMAYPEGYQGGTGAASFVAACKALGFTLSSLDTGSAEQSVADAHQLLAQNTPVIFTEVDPYVPSSYGWSHVCVFYQAGQGTLTAMDPWPGKPVVKSDAEWAHALLDNQIWIVEELPMSISLTTPGVSRFFEAVPGNSSQWRCIQNSHIIQYGILQAYQNYGNSGSCGLTFLGLPLSDEIAIDPVKYPHVVKQYFERGCLVYDPAHLIDSAPGGGGVYAAHLYDGGVGTDPALTDLQGVYVGIYAAYQTQKATIATQLAQIAQLQQQQPPDQSGVLAAYQSAFAALSGLNTQAQAILANPLKS